MTEGGSPPQGTVPHSSGKLKAAGFLATFQGHTNEVPHAVFSPDGQQVLTASDDKTARLWRAEDGKLLVIFAHTESVNSAVFGPDGSRVLTASADNTAKLWEAESGKLLVTFVHASYVDGAVFSPDGRRVLSTSGDNAVRLWEAESGRLAATFRSPIVTVARQVTPTTSKERSLAGMAGGYSRPHGTIPHGSGKLRSAGYWRVSKATPTGL